MQYIFVLGRDQELSKLEIESVLENKGINYKVSDEGKGNIVIDCEKLKPSIIDEFGGIIKIVEVISNSSRIDHIEDNLSKVEIYNGKSNKIEYYIDAFSTDLLSFVEDYLKDYFKSIKLKALYRREGEPSKLVSKNILETGINIVVFKSFIGKVIAITNPKEFKERDLARPEVDYMKVISIRLAKILVNISKVKKGETLLDPFCGAGTILQEALLNGVNVIGTDKDEDSINQAQKNIEWLVKRYYIKNSYSIIKLDCKDLSKRFKKNSINCVVTEPYMGPYIKRLPNIEEAKKLISELSILYDVLISNLKFLLKKEGRIVIII